MSELKELFSTMKISTVVSFERTTGIDIVGPDESYSDYDSILVIHFDNGSYMLYTWGGECDVVVGNQMVRTTSLWKAFTILQKWYKELNG